MQQLTSLPPKFVNADKEETLTCKGCSKEWTRFSRRGRKPHYCPECVEAEAQRISEPVPQEVLEARMAKAREKKQENAREAAKRASEAQAQERARVTRMLPNMHLMWNHAFTVALEENTDAAWNKCDSLMQSYLNAKRELMK